MLARIPIAGVDAFTGQPLGSMLRIDAFATEALRELLVVFACCKAESEWLGVQSERLS